MLIGDSRTMLANHFFAKADAYFHKGYYPSIFDTPKNEETHMSAEHAGESHDDHAEDEGFLGAPHDWIDRFSRNFFPSHHSHLEKDGEEREILPWLKLTADLDPQRVETYTIASYWLRRRLGKVNEAEDFLREGLRANPESYEIYFELGRVYDENRHDPLMARNLWEVALRKWNAQSKRAEEENNPALKPDDLVFDGITARLAKVEETQGNISKAIHYMELLEENVNKILAQKKLDPVYRKGTEERLQTIQQQIKELEAKSAAKDNAVFLIC
jgi:tetratricopeptide (TPR) repeat protein